MCEPDALTKCEGELEASIHKLRRPRLVIFNIPKDISTQNLEDTLMAQNPESWNKGDIEAKFCYTRKQNRVLVMEVGAQSRNLLIQSKSNYVGKYAKSRKI